MSDGLFQSSLSKTNSLSAYGDSFAIKKPQNLIKAFLLFSNSIGCRHPHILEHDFSTIGCPDTQFIF